MSAKPHYLGHRQRLKDRFMRDAGASMPDYEMLELVLFMAKPRADVKPLAKALLQRFGSFAEVISADPKELVEVKGVRESIVIALKTIQAAAIRLAREQVINRNVSVGSHPAERTMIFKGLARVSRSLAAAKSVRGSSWGSRARKKPPRTARGEPWTVESVV
ncbi:MAG: hypothetical protein V3T93_08520 [Alphaproteobacteria bacterium]